MRFLKTLLHFKQTKHIHELTNFLEHNSSFRNAVLKFHRKKGSFWKSLDTYLEKELIHGKDKGHKHKPRHIEAKNNFDSDRKI